MSRSSLILIVALVALSAMGVAVYRMSHEGSAGGGELTVYCAANFKKPVEELAGQFGQKFGVSVHPQFGGTGTLLGQMQVAKKGDLFIPADEGSLEDAKKKGLVRETIPIVVQHPVVGVKKGNPKGIHTAADLLRADIRLSLPNPDAASIGRVTRQLLGTQWQPIADHAAVMKPTVTDAAADVQVGSVDAAFVWDSTVPQFFGMEAVELPELSEHREHIAVVILSFCEQPEKARQFAQFLAAPDQGGVVFKRDGFQLPATAP